MGSAFDHLKEAGRIGISNAIQAIARVAGPVATSLPKVALDQLSP